MSKPKRVLVEDWGWFWATEDRSTFIFIRYTWRHRVRLLMRLYRVIRHGAKMRPPLRLVCHADSAWFIASKDKSTFIHVGPTCWRRIRQLIGIDRYRGRDEYVHRSNGVKFRWNCVELRWDRVKSRGRLHYFLNRWLTKGP